MSIQDKARAWADGDCDVETQAELRLLIERGTDEQLHQLVAGDLAFGTAGLRAKVGPGSLRMNRAVVRRTTHALAEELIASHPDARSLPVVVGYDGRLSSRVFAEDTCAVLVAHGLLVRYFEHPIPTPIVAYALRRYSAVAAVVITASHNPAEDNGYKLYDANGAQIIAPKDERIAARIAMAPAAKDVPYAAGAMEGGKPLAEPVACGVVEAYFRDIDGLRPKTSPARDLRIVYTAMHGVGYAPVKRALATAGFACVFPVAEQVEPDGTFPTTRFPNPEEEGALSLALALAEREEAELVLANDPDADRLAACVRKPEGTMLKLTGNQLGVLLADYQLGRYHGKERALVASSIVSTPMLASIAAKYGAHCAVTFTGFKWVWNAALDLHEEQNLHFVFGFEEALGYSAEDIVRDKDGIAAALLLAELAAELKSRGSSLYQRLEELYVEHGLWISFQKSVTCDPLTGKTAIANAMDRLAEAPPVEFCGIAVTEMTDYRVASEARPRWLASDTLLRFELGESGRVLVRPSGTEPKLKVYVDLRRVVTVGKVWEQTTPATDLASGIAEALLGAMEL